MVCTYRQGYLDAATGHPPNHPDPPIPIFVERWASDTSPVPEDFQNRPHVDIALDHALLKVRFVHTNIVGVHRGELVDVPHQLPSRGTCLAHLGERD